MNDEIKEILNIINYKYKDYYVQDIVSGDDLKLLSDCITNLQEKLRIRDTNWQSLKYYLEKLYNRDYIEEEIFDDICKRVNELESQIEIKGYQKEITNLQQENEDLKDRLKVMEHFKNSLFEENNKLKKENIKLYKKDTKIINELKEELEITQEKWNKDKQWSECRTKDWLDYKSRCEKADKFIMSKHNWYGDEEEDNEEYLFELEDFKELLNIINGR